MNKEELTNASIDPIWAIVKFHLWVFGITIVGMVAAAIYFLC